MPVGADSDQAIGYVKGQVAVIEAMLAGCLWREGLAKQERKTWLNAILLVTNFLKFPANADNADPKGEHKLPQRFRLAVQRLERYWSLCSRRTEIEEIREQIAFFRDVRVHMMQAEANARKAWISPIYLLAVIARDLIRTLRRDSRPDWSVRSDVRARMRSTIRRLLVRLPAGSAARGCAAGHPTDGDLRRRLGARG